MKKIICIFVPILIMAALITVVGYVNLSSPLMQNKAQIKKENVQVREYVLSILPLGTDMDTAQQIITNHPIWEIDLVSEDRGYGIGTDSRPSGYEKVMVGEKSIQIHLGEYKGILMTTGVLAFLGFDENGKLIDVAVRKDIDSL